MFMMLSGLLIITGVASAKHAGLILQEAMYAEGVDGDLDKAIDLYESILDDDNVESKYAAHAAHGLGSCYLRKGDQTKAIKLFREVLSKYPQEKIAVDKARMALKQIDKNASFSDSGSPEMKGSERIVDVKTTSGPYMITVDRVRRDNGRGGTSLSHSGFPMTPMRTFQNTTSKSKRNRDSGGSNNTMTESETGASTSAMGSAGGGGFVFKRPNLILDVEVINTKPRERKQQLVCAVNGRVRGEDDQGNELESPDTPAAMGVELLGVPYRRGDGRTAIHLFQPGSGAEAESIRFIEGELLVADGIVGQITFDGKELMRPTSKTENGVTVNTGKFRKTPKGIKLTLGVSPSPMQTARTPFEEMQHFVSARGRIKVEMEDSRGKIHDVVDVNQSRKSGSTGESSGGGSSSWSSSSHSSSGSSDDDMDDADDTDDMNIATDEGLDTIDLRFDPLPDGVEVKSVTCTITDIIGRPKPVPFRLENIPLPE